jgi:hypothetical protein
MNAATARGTGVCWGLPAPACRGPLFAGQKRDCIDQVVAERDEGIGLGIGDNLLFFFKRDRSAF